MQELPVQSLSDPRLTLYRGVSEPALLRRHGCFIAEGRVVVERLIARSPGAIQSLLVNPAACEALRSTLEKHSVQAPVFVCEPSEFEALTGHQFHRGCLALVERPAPVPWRQVAQGARRLVVLEGVGNPDNVGSVFRSAAALGADGVLLGPGTCDPLYRKAVRTSMGAVFQLPYAQFSEADSDYAGAIEALGQLGVDRLALSLRSPCVELQAWARSRAQSENGRPLALFVGAEGPGLSACAEAAADVRLRIDMSAGVDSLNLGVATAIALFALR